MPVVVTPIPVVLGGRTLTPLARYAREGFAADYALGGYPWLDAIRDDDPLSRVTTPYQRERVDQSSSAGESSLSNWWLRSATDWSKGAGITFYDADEADLSRYADSFNIDVWTEGQISLLKATTQTSPFITSIKQLESAQDGLWVLTTSGTVGFKDTGEVFLGNPGTTTGVQQITSDGRYCYAAKSDGIYKLDSADNTVTKIHSAPSGGWTVQSMGYVKDRLIVGAMLTTGQEMHLFELARKPATIPYAVTTATDSRWSYELPSLSFAGVTETTGAVMFGTNLGTKSKVWSMTIATTTDGNVTVLEPVTIAEFPTGENVRVLRSYLGTYVGIGTSRGIRVGIETQNGVGFTYGPLVVKDDVKDLVFSGDYMYATRNTVKGTAKGLWRVALGTPVDDTYAYAPDLSSSSSTVWAVATDGVNGRLAIGASDSLWLESATTYSVSGELTSGLIRFGTTEKKQAVSVLSRLSGDVSGGVVFRLTAADGSFRDYSNFTTGETTDWSVSSQLLPSSSFEAKITLNRGTTTSTPVLEEWQVRGLPAPQKSRTITIPLMCYPRENDDLGNVNVTDAFDRLQVLELLEAYGGAVLFQDFATGEERIVVVRAVEYKQTGPASFKDGFGGIVTVQLQTVDTEV